MEKTIITKNLYKLESKDAIILAGTEMVITQDWGNYLIVKSKEHPELGDYIISSNLLVSKDEWEQFYNPKLP